jgi:EAL domain-containing protein (putative c-di-GMP-specific phosphodiesterase class I)
LSLQIGEWVIATALAQLSSWAGDGQDFVVSVNVDAYQLQQPNFVSRVEALLAACPLPKPGSMVFEILESNALQNTDGVSHVIRSCQKMGIGFALDDFGIGYSSLTYLKRLPVETLKIDRSFVRDMLTDRDDLAIVKGVIALAKAFQRRVIAEGVETQAQMDRLKLLGCDCVQGFGIARPMPADDFHAWIESRQHGLLQAKPV